MALTNAQNTLLVIKDKMPFFQDLDNDQVLEITEDVRFTKLEKGALIFEEGEQSTEIYYIVSGSVDISIAKEEEGKVSHISVAVLEKKGLFGEMAFITKESRSARATAAEDDTSILRFRVTETVTDTNVHALASLYFRFSQLLADKLRITSQKFVQASSGAKVN